MIRFYFIAPENEKKLYNVLSPGRFVMIITVLSAGNKKCSGCDQPMNRELLPYLFKGVKNVTIPVE